MTQPRVAAFVVMRATAVVLAVLVLGHFAVTHVVNDVAETDSSFVLRQWSSALWLAWDWAMLVAALAHAGTGIWLLVDEQATAARTRRLCHAALAGTVAVLLAVGTAALTIAATR